MYVSASTLMTSLQYCDAKSIARTIAKIQLGSQFSSEAATAKEGLTYVPDVYYQIREPPEYLQGNPGTTNG